MKTPMGTPERQMGTLFGCQIGLIISNFEYSYQPENAKTFRAIGTRERRFKTSRSMPCSAAHTRLRQA